MKILIFEDEKLTAERLIQLIKRYKPDVEVLEVIDSVSKGVEWIMNNALPDLIFMDIQLTDGTSFEIFNKVNIELPIIFTTAYDEYAIKAFKVNSIDYIVKPVDYEELKAAILKYEKIIQKQTKINPDVYQAMYSQITKDYKKRFLVKIGDQFKAIQISEIAYFMFDQGIAFLYTHLGKSYPIDFSLDQIEAMVNPDEFFRINRKFIIYLDTIEKIHTYFNSRLKLNLKPEPEEEVIVSREKVSTFKAWLGK